jgi:thiosulfate dehydrogenase
MKPSIGRNEQIVILQSNLGHLASLYLGKEVKWEADPRMKRVVTSIASFGAGLFVLPLVVYLYLVFGRPPVATADTPFPFEAKIVKVPLEARIHREMPAATPLQRTDENLTAGAETYRQECSFCHGLRNKPAAAGKTMFPSPPQLWAKHRNSGVVGVSDDPVGETYWKVKNGIRLSGMPAYEGVLSEQQIWQVSFLLSSADQSLPSSAAKLIEP